MSADLYHPYPVSNGGGQAIRSPGAVSVGWTITGYAIPNEDQFPGTPTITVHVFDGGRGIAGTFLMTSGFVDKTRINGAGSVSGGIASAQGWYLANMNGVADFVNQVASGLSVSGGFSADGYYTIFNTVATPIITSGGLTFGTELKIPTIPVEPFRGLKFQAHDRGGFTDLHADVFCGEGSGAFNNSFAITSLPPNNLGTKVVLYHKPTGQDPLPISGLL